MEQAAGTALLWTCMSVGSQVRVVEATLSWVRSLLAAQGTPAGTPPHSLAGPPAAPPALHWARRPEQFLLLIHADLTWVDSCPTG